MLNRVIPNRLVVSELTENEWTFWSLAEVGNRDFDYTEIDKLKTIKSRDELMKIVSSVRSVIATSRQSVISTHQYTRFLIDKLNLTEDVACLINYLGVTTDCFRLTQVEELGPCFHGGVSEAKEKKDELLSIKKIPVFSFIPISPEPKNEINIESRLPDHERYVYHEGEEEVFLPTPPPQKSIRIRRIEESAQ